ncbi:MAG: class I SAM-dependent methyltransferase [Desulfovibrionaceae bacterium]
MTNDLDIWHATYEAKTLEELDNAYRQWAPRYDHDTVQGMGYVAPEAAAAMLDQHLDSREASVLDAGCGTGLVGLALSRLGYANIHAMDYSEHMLGQAKSKRVYGDIFQADMSLPLEIEDDSYDAAICVGTFTYAHVGPEAFKELVRVTRPGGYVAFTIRDGAYQEYDYRTGMIDLEAERKWELETMIDHDYLVKEGVVAKFCTYRVLDA